MSSSLSILGWAKKAQWSFLTSYKVNRLRTRIHSLVHPTQHRRLVFIFGCQRSGTTMLRSFIGFDPRINDIGEGDPPYFWQVPVEDPRYLRAVPDQEIEELSQAQSSPIVLIKPLHDSQRAAALLDRFPTAKGIWIFRHYREVILSHLHYYKKRYDPLPYVQDLLDLNSKSWKAESLSEEMAEFIRSHRAEITTPTAAYALFWLARNSLLFQNFHPALITLNYADMVRQPQAALALLSRHIELPLDERYAQFPETRERKQELPDEIPMAIKTACDEMFERLVRQASAIT